MTPSPCNFRAHQIVMSSLRPMPEPMGGPTAFSKTFRIVSRYATIGCNACRSKWEIGASEEVAQLDNHVGGDALELLRSWQRRWTLERSNLEHMDQSRWCGLSYAAP